MCVDVFLDDVYMGNVCSPAAADSSSSDSSDGGGTGGAESSSTPSSDPTTTTPPETHSDPPPPTPPVDPIIKQKPDITCLGDAVAEGALAVGLDSIGFIPEAGGVARIIGHQAGYRGVVADQFGGKLLRDLDHTKDASEGLFGFGDTSAGGLLSTGLTIAAFIPGLNDVAAAVSVGRDLYKTAKAIGQCYYQA